jgi:hypothetical protein
VLFDLPYIIFLRNVSFLEELSETLPKMYIGRRIKCLLFLADFTEKLITSIDFRKILRCTYNFINICLMGAELFHEDEHTHDKANSQSLLAISRTRLQIIANVYVIPEH